MTDEAAPFLESTKYYENYPCAHRQPRHDGNCALVHGYSRSFLFTFRGIRRNKCGFLVDYGDLKWLKAHLDYMYDHTLLLEYDDPLLDLFKQIEAAGGAAIRHQPDGVGMEGTAMYLLNYADPTIRQKSQGRCWVHSVEARENSKNSSIYYNPNSKYIEL